MKGRHLLGSSETEPGDGRTAQPTGTGVTDQAGRWTGEQKKPLQTQACNLSGLPRGGRLKPRRGDQATAGGYWQVGLRKRRCSCWRWMSSYSPMMG